MFFCYICQSLSLSNPSIHFHSSRSIEIHSLLQQKGYHLALVYFISSSKTQFQLSTIMRKMPLENIVEKRENAGNNHFLVFPQFLLPFPKQSSIFQLHFFGHLQMLFNRLILWGLMSFSTVFQLYRGSQCNYPCFPGVLFSDTPHNILSKPLAAFPHNHC